ncbi:Calpain-like protease 1 [Komagataella phaffii CBS 7435]|uniref:Cysteine protease RIM13 n=2 Tax=Komagataella phaffii TaxID=460519 RepID=C4R548_KOMPG|nr:Calpain-like cysteine protease [Komagataella phaffii GS115]AOA63281.1 GQ67_03720T0 [Komagataella phaffii]CAH2449542.1 Calpain-like protease 1 [Komagataella phaffii CBS 7435]AOA68900.1 GQ68_03692T0 [Komagataella phaffii GS115]CAY70684.1 Calpain-like cysteine protease [Komagataella phaffii GS115]SCV12216.1 Calpain-like protease 1 [Komagataella phaffii CBS 7435]
MDHAQRLLELSFYNQSLGKSVIAKKYRIESSRYLNEQLDKSLTRDNDLIGLCRIALDNKLTISDKIIWMSSQVEDNFFPPVFQGLKTYIDSDEIYQEKLLSVPADFEPIVEWKSCTELPNEWSNNGVDNLFQDSLDDCSFVASFLSCNNIGIPLMDKVIPHKNSFKYAVRLTFNGCERLVFIDSRLPLLRNTSKTLRVSSFSNKDLLWPSIIEKAFLKMCDDGYKFSGSNSAIANYALTGWIPEVIKTSSCTIADISRLHEDFRNGNVVLCLGTGNLTERECKQYGLIPNHDYAVTKLSFTNDSEYKFDIRNPWTKGQKAVTITDLSTFEVIYANRNPIMFSHMNQLSGICQSQVNEEFIDLILNHSQYTLGNDGNSTIDVILFFERHSLRKKISAESRIEIFQSEGERLISRRNKASKECVSNNTNFHFITIELKPLEKVTVVIDIGESSIRSHPFTLKAFANDSTITLNKALSRPGCFKQMDLELTPLNSGGNWDNYAYYKNPQLIVTLHGDSTDEAPFESAVFSKSDKTLFTYTVFWKSDDPDFPFITDASKNKLVSTDNKYKYRSCTRSRVVSCDKSYLFVLSSYEPDAIESFKVFFQCSHDFSIEWAETSLGLFTKEETFSWKDQLVKEFIIQVYNPSKLKVHAVNTNNKRRSKLNCSLSFQNTLISSLQDYTDNLYGCFISGNLEIPGKYLLQVHKNIISNEECLVEIGSSSSFELWEHH